MFVPARAPKASSSTRISTNKELHARQLRNISYQEYKRTEDNVLDIAKRTIRTPDLKPDSNLTEAIFPSSSSLSKIKRGYAYWEGAAPSFVKFSSVGAFSKEVNNTTGVDISLPFLTILNTPSDVAKGILVLQKTTPFSEQKVEDPSLVRKSKAPTTGDAGEYYDKNFIDIPWYKSGWTYQEPQPRTSLKEYPLEEVVQKLTTALNQLPSKKEVDTPTITPETSFAELNEHFSPEDIRIAARLGIPTPEGYFGEVGVEAAEEIPKYARTFSNVRDLAAFLHDPTAYKWNLHAKVRPDFASRAEEHIANYYEKQGAASVI